MAWDILKDEYLELAGIPLATPAWDLEDIDDVLSSPPLRGQNLVVPFRQGELPQRWTWAAKPLDLRFNVYGTRDGEGELLAVDSAYDGVARNIDVLKKAFRPRQDISEGTMLLRHIRLSTSSEIRQAQVNIVEPLRAEMVPPTMARCSLGLLIPRGVMNNPDETVDTLGPFTEETDITVLNPGTADQFDVRLELTGTATGVRLTNLTWNSDGVAWLEFNGQLQSGVFIDTDLFTVFREVGEPDLQPVGGLRQHSGHERWFPLAPGDNTVRVTPEGGNVTVVYRHHAPYA